MDRRGRIASPWRKSSYSGGVNNCVEVAGLPSAVAVRDSTRPDAGHLTFPRPEWSALLGALRNDELDEF